MNGTFATFGFADIDAKFITIHVKEYKAWTKEDVLNPENHIHLLWGENRHNNPQAQYKLDQVRIKLDKNRVLSDVGILLPRSCLLFYSTELSRTVQRYQQQVV